MSPPSRSPSRAARTNTDKLDVDFGEAAIDPRPGIRRASVAEMKEKFVLGRI